MTGLDGLSFDAEHELPDGTIGNSPCVTLVDAERHALLVRVEQTRQIANMIATGDRPGESSEVTEAFDRVVKTLRKEARRLKREADRA